MRTMMSLANTKCSSLHRLWTIVAWLLVVGWVFGPHIVRAQEDCETATAPCEATLTSCTEACGEDVFCGGDCAVAFGECIQTATDTCTVDVGADDTPEETREDVDYDACTAALQSSDLNQTGTIDSVQEFDMLVTTYAGDRCDSEKLNLTQVAFPGIACSLCAEGNLTLDELATCCNPDTAGFEIALEGERFLELCNFLEDWVVVECDTNIVDCAETFSNECATAQDECAQNCSSDDTACNAACVASFNACIQACLEATDGGSGGGDTEGGGGGGGDGGETEGDGATGGGEGTSGTPDAVDEQDPTTPSTSSGPVVAMLAGAPAVMAFFASLFLF